jgi:hypothetical protein
MATTGTRRDIIELIGAQIEQHKLTKADSVGFASK